jgi:molecular chaperone DnaJ
MNIQEAYNVLEVQDSISDTDLKSTYKKLAKQFHPDVYKTDTDKFKKINEAYQLIIDYRKNPEKYNPQSRSPFSGGGFNINLNDIFNGFGRSQQTNINASPINLNTKISFKESVLGVEKEISYKKNIKCSDCDGNGKEPQSNGCKSCNGFGRVIQQQGNMHYSTGCSKCHGRNVKFKDCIKCNAKGITEVEVNAKINIPSGNSTTLRIQGAGNYGGSAGIMGDVYSDVFLKVEVEPDPDLTLVGTDVIFKLNLPLIDALIGCEKEVKTIYDTRTIIIPAKSKNKEEIIIEGCGVKQAKGNERVILDIDYGDTDKLIEFLKQEGK